MHSKNGKLSENLTYDTSNPNKMCLNEIYCGVRVGKHSSDVYSITNGLKLGDVLSSLLFNFPLEYVMRLVRQIFSSALNVLSISVLCLTYLFLFIIYFSRQLS
jgi:hypothetical protein